MDRRIDKYTNLRIEKVPGFRYVEHTIISTNPKVIGWDFPKLSVEQINVCNMHGYTAALIIPNGITMGELEIKEQPAHKYAAIHIDRTFNDPFVTIPGAYGTLNDYMRTNGLVYDAEGGIPCFETAGESMDVYIACK